jgi:hypothetical protein
MQYCTDYCHACAVFTVQLLHLLPALLHCMVVNAFKGNINLKLLYLAFRFSGCLQSTV